MEAFLTILSLHGVNLNEKTKRHLQRSLEAGATLISKMRWLKFRLTLSLLDLASKNGLLKKLRSCPPKQVARCFHKKRCLRYQKLLERRVQMMLLQPLLASKLNKSLWPVRPSKPTLPVSHKRITSIIQITRQERPLALLKLRQAVLGNNTQEWARPSSMKCLLT